MKDNVSEFVLKLSKLTQKDEVKWTSRNTENLELPTGDIVLGKIYSTLIKERKFQMFRYKYQHWTDIDTFIWNQRTRLEMIELKAR